MNRLLRVRNVVFLALFTFVLVYAIDSVAYMRLFGTVPSVTPGQCRRLDNLRGAEDMIERRNGVVVASLNDRVVRSGSPSANDNGALVEVSLANQAPRVLWNGAGRIFSPHGIDYFVDADGQEYLFVINHADGEDVVMIFRFEGAALILQREVKFQEQTLNDLTAVAPDRFYVTIDHGTNNALVNTISDYLRLPTGSVDYFDGSKITVAASNILYANGIVASHGKDRLYVASMLAGKVIAFNVKHAALSKAEEFDVAGSPDNLTLTKDGGLLVAVHPKILKLSAQRRHRDELAPSMVQLIEHPDLKSSRIDTLFANDGSLQSSASVALSLGEKIIIGSVFGDHALLCDANSKTLK